MADPAAAFAAWDFASDSAFASYAASVEVTDPTRWPVVRAKWYKKHVNPRLDVDAVRAAACGRPHVHAAAAPRPAAPRPPPPRTSARPTSTAAATGTLLAVDAATLATALVYTLTGGGPGPAWRRFALAAALGHAARLVTSLGRPPLDPAALPASLVALVPWVVRAGGTSDGALLAFLVVAGRAPSLPAALPAALLSAAHALETGVSAAGPAAPAWAVRARASAAGRAASLGRAAAGAELATGALLTLGLFSGRAGLWAVLLFWRTYLPFRLRSADGRHHAALLAQAAGAVACVAGGGGFGAWARSLEAGLRDRAGAA